MPGAAPSLISLKDGPSQPVSLFIVNRSGARVVVQRIVTFTMNPAVDVSSTVGHIVASHKLRCGNVRHDAGGGGINVARVVKRLGGNPLAIFPAGGPMGALLERLVLAENVPYLAIPITNDTREDFTVSETSTGAQYRFVLPGPELSEAETAACLNAATRNLERGSFLVASGSLPPNVSDNFYASLGRHAAEAGVRFVLDTSGTPLKAALSGTPFLIKPSQSELGQIAGAVLSNRKQCIAAAQEIVQSGRAGYVAVSLGSDGAVLVGKECSFSALAPRVNSRTTVGAGDSFLASLILAFSRGLNAAQALKQAVAAGSAALLATGTGLCARDDVERLAAQVTVQELGTSS